jgi:hypothetical protein
MAQFIHYCAQNDRNGNPQRCFVLLDPDDNAILLLRGMRVITGTMLYLVCGAEMPTTPNGFHCSIAKYKQLLRTLPSPDWAHDVPGYSHLRSLVS